MTETTASEIGRLLFEDIRDQVGAGFGIMPKRHSLKSAEGLRLAKRAMRYRLYGDWLMGKPTRLDPHRFDAPNRNDRRAKHFVDSESYRKRSGQARQKVLAIAKEYDLEPEALCFRDHDDD